MTLGEHRVSLEWGEVLGASEYRLYRRKIGEADFTQIYKGTDRKFVDDSVAAHPALEVPGMAEQAEAPGKAGDLYEYAVAAVDGNGEGPKCVPIDDDPANWRNWLPPTPLVFRRQSAFWLPPYVRPEDVPAPFYPQ
jgi:hypothetical protein